MDASARGSREMPRIGLVATDPMRVEGFRAILCDGVLAEVVALEAPRANELAEIELVIIDEAATDHSLELIAAFQRMRPQIRLVVVGKTRDADYTERVIDAGAKGYLFEGSSEEEFKSAVEAVRDGSMWAPRKVLVKLLEIARKAAASPIPEAIRFTRRETEVLHLLVLGRSNGDIAKALGLDVGTVKAHLARLMRKTNVSNRTALTMRTMEEGWLR